MVVHGRRDGGRPVPPELVDLGHELLTRLDLTHNDHMVAHHVVSVARLCLKGPNGKELARRLAERLRPHSAPRWRLEYTHEQLIVAIVSLQPLAALDQLVVRGGDAYILERCLVASQRRHPFDEVSPSTLLIWARLDPDARFVVIAQSLRIFAADSLSPLALEVIEAAPDREKVLAAFEGRWEPRSRSGSMADILEERRRSVAQLGDHPDPVEQRWSHGADAAMLQSIGYWRGQERARDDRFEW